MPSPLRIDAMVRKGLDLQEASFARSVLDNPKPVVVEFYAGWCGACKAINPVIEEAARILDGRISFLLVDVDREPGLAERYEVQAVPTLLFFRAGRVVGRMIGAHSGRGIWSNFRNLLGEPENR